jgi:hypothetical protein
MPKIVKFSISFGEEPEQPRPGKLLPDADETKNQVAIGGMASTCGLGRNGTTNRLSCGKEAFRGQ